MNEVERPSVLVTVLVRCVEAGGHVCVMASEENEEIIPIPPQYPHGKYVLMFDPLDGSSNIDVNISIGTIFSIHKKITPGEDGRLEDCLQPGHKQVAAGYVIYGSSVVLVYTTGSGVFGPTRTGGTSRTRFAITSISKPRRSAPDRRTSSPTTRSRPARRDSSAMSLTPARSAR